MTLSETIFGITSIKLDGSNISKFNKNLEVTEPGHAGDNDSAKHHDSARLDSMPMIADRSVWGDRVLKKIAAKLPRYLRHRLLSFKNQILISTLVLMAIVVLIIGIALQIAVFPKLKDDEIIIRNIKAIHFGAGLVVIVISWIFVELVSRRITSRLRDLTSKADEISRGATDKVVDSGNDGRIDQDTNQGDEITQLTVSFNRMLAHLKSSQRRLRESEAKYRFLFDNGPSPIFVMDANNLHLLDVNARAEEEYQYSKDELLSMKFTDLGLEQDRTDATEGMKRLQSDVTLLHLLRHRRKDGSIFMVNYQASPTRYLNRPAIIAAVWDVTKRLEKYAQLIQAGKMATLGEMATGIAHEINQPLSVMKLACDYMMKKIRAGYQISSDELSNITKECNLSVDRASNIINHLREFGRRAEDTMRLVNLNTPIYNVFTLLGRQLQLRGIRWDLRLAQDLPPILGDANRLEQVFINLVVNARDAVLGTQDLGRQPLIIVESYAHDNKVIVKVCDNGPGIPKDVGIRIFEPFFTTKKTGEGTGIGLSISYGIINEHKGAIELDSSVEIGAAFILTFPSYQPGGSDD